MISLKALLYLVLCAMVLAVDKQTEEERGKKIYTDCQKESNMEQKEFEEWGKLKKNPSEKVLCFLKCLFDKDGTFDKNGKIGPDVVEKIVKLTNLDDTKKAKVKSCLEKLPPVKTCDDMKAMVECTSGGN